MKSMLTQKSYEYVHFITVNHSTKKLTSLDGVTYEELADHTWIGINGELKGMVRYHYTANHGGGISLLPAYELVDDEWFSLRSGEPAPPAINKEES